MDRTVELILPNVFLADVLPGKESSRRLEPHAGSAALCIMWCQILAARGKSVVSIKGRYANGLTVVSVAIVLVLSLLALTLSAAPANAQTPTCASASSDSDGDGWGFENGVSCRVAEGQASGTGTPTCASASSDPDGDGFGFENGVSCRVAEGQTGSDSAAKSVPSADGSVISIVSPAEGATVQADSNSEIEIEASIAFPGEPEQVSTVQSQSLPTNVVLLVESSRVSLDDSCGSRSGLQCSWDSVTDTLQELSRLNGQGHNYRVSVVYQANQRLTDRTQGFVDPATALTQIGSLPSASASSSINIDGGISQAGLSLASEDGAKQIVVLGSTFWLQDTPWPVEAEVAPGITVDFRVIGASGSCPSDSWARQLAEGAGTCSTHGSAFAAVPTFIPPETTSVGGVSTQLPVATHRVTFYHRPLGSNAWQQFNSRIHSGQTGSRFGHDIALPNGTHEVQLRAQREVVVNGIGTPDPATEFSVTRTITVTGSDVADASPEDFRQWLLGLSRSEISTELSFYNGTATLNALSTADDSFGFKDFRLRIPINPFGAQVQSLTGFITTGGGGENSGVDLADVADIGIVRDENGVVIDLIEPSVAVQFDRALDQLDAAERGTLDQFVDFTSGCFASVAEFATAMKTIFLELWGNIDFDYFASKISEILEIRDAFLSDPVAFFEQFLQQIVRAEEYDNNRSRWAGMIVCDLAIGLVSGGVGGVVGRLLQRMPEIRAFSVTSDRGSDSSPTDSCLFGGDSGFDSVDGQLRKIQCISAATRSFQEVDERFSGSTEFSIVAKPDTNFGGTNYNLTGQITQGHNRRSDFEKAYLAPGIAGLPSGQYDRAHLVGVNGTGSEAGQILYATQNFNRSFQSIVELRMQEGFRIATVKGWTLHYDIHALSYPDDVAGGGVLRTVSYDLNFETDEGLVRFMSADGGQSAPSATQAGTTTREFIFVEEEFR